MRLQQRAEQRRGGVSAACSAGGAAADAARDERAKRGAQRPERRGATLRHPVPNPSVHRHKHGRARSATAADLRAALRRRVHRSGLRARARRLQRGAEKQHRQRADDGCVG